MDWHHQQRRVPAKVARRAREPLERPAFAPPIETREIFRELIASEIRAGCLSPRRRRRVVRYASRMGLSAREAGELVAQCRDELLNGGDPVHRQHALRLVQPLRPRWGPAILVAGWLVVAGLCLNALLRCLW